MMEVVETAANYKELRRALPADDRQRLPLHQVLALVDANRPGIPVLSANADGSLTLAEPLPVGQRLRWVMRQALAAEQEMQQLIGQYRDGIVPLVVPLTLLKHHLRRHPQPYLALQAYLQPHPENLSLRNAI